VAQWHSGTCGGDEKGLQDFGKELGHFEEVGVDGRITLTWIWKKCDEM